MASAYKEYDLASYKRKWEKSWAVIEYKKAPVSCFVNRVIAGEDGDPVADVVFHGETDNKIVRSPKFYYHHWRTGFFQSQGSFWYLLKRIHAKQFCAGLRLSAAPEGKPTHALWGYKNGGWNKLNNPAISVASLTQWAMLPPGASVGPLSSQLFFGKDAVFFENIQIAIRNKDKIIAGSALLGSEIQDAVKRNKLSCTVEW